MKGLGGFRYIENALSKSLTARLGAAIENGVIARKDSFLDVPHTIAAVKQTHEDVDPMYKAVSRRVKMLNARRRRKRLLQQQQQHQPSKGPTGDQEITSAASLINRPKNDIQVDLNDINAMTRKIAAQLVGMSPADSSIDNDPQRISAINKHQVNLWMTEPELKKEVYGELGKTVGEIVKPLLEDPILFSDRPTFVPGTCRPSALHFSAPAVGIEHHESKHLTAWVFCESSSELRCPIYLLKESHTHVAKEIASRRVNLAVLRNDFTPTDSHISLWLRHFPQLMSDAAVETIYPEAGSVLLLHPYTFFGWGPNLTDNAWRGLQLNIVSSGATPNVGLHSWLKEWRSSSDAIDFKNSVVFPPMRP